MNSNRLDLSQAYKIYTGDSLGIAAIKLGFAGVLMYSATLICFIFMGFLGEGNITHAWSEISGEVIVNTFITIDSAIILTIFGLMSYDKYLPGGKYFRTVKGGFDTYRKMKNANLIIRIIAVTAILVFSVLIDISGFMKLAGGSEDVLFIGSCLFAGVWMLNLTSLIKNQAIRGGVSVIAVTGAGICGVILPQVNGSLLIPLVIAAASLPLVIITHRLLLRNYRNHFWNN